MDLEIIKNKTQTKSNDRNLDLMEVEMTLQNASLAHEYLRLEFENVRCSVQKFELSEKLEGYKKAYFDARRYLEVYNPERLEKIEEELMIQKKEIFTYYSA